MDLFRAVLEHEAKAVADEIRLAAPMTLGEREALVAGSLAYLDAMMRPGRTRLLLVEGPSVLGLEETMAIDAGRDTAQTRAAMLWLLGRILDAEN